VLVFGGRCPGVGSAALVHVTHTRRRSAGRGALVVRAELVDQLTGGVGDAGQHDRSLRRGGTGQWAARLLLQRLRGTDRARRRRRSRPAPGRRAAAALEARRSRCPWRRRPCRDRAPAGPAAARRSWAGSGPRSRPSDGSTRPGAGSLSGRERLSRQGRQAACARRRVFGEAGAVAAVLSASIAVLATWPHALPPRR
jgi:hypothetical protein